MRYSQLRSFHAVAEAGSFTAAARAARVSQPTITTQVRALEAQFGVELFVRHGRRVIVTETGRGLHEITLRLFGQEEDARSYLVDSGALRTGHLRVGAVGPYHVTDMLAAVAARYPQLYVSVTIGNSREIVQSLLDYRTDVAVLAHIDPDPRLLAIPYSRHPVVVFVPARHPLAKRRAIRIEELDGQPMVVREAGSTTRRAFEEALARAKVSPRIVMEIGGREAIREAVAKGIGIGVVSEAEFVPGRNLRALPVTNAAIYTYAHVVCLKERQNARLVRAFRAIVDELRAARAEQPPAAGRRRHR
ncbi:MAG: LysR family transcriptional regulator [Proteobacteria bacterium]|nr:LysR family transcriptional regulator [Pseudomonadota bacterium]